MKGIAAGYGELLSEEKPEVVRGEQQNQRYIEKLEKLTGQDVVTPAEEKLIALLTVLVEEYEAKQHPVPEAGPLDIVRHLMGVHGLRQKDLVDVFGAESIVSDVLHRRVPEVAGTGELMGKNV